MGGLVEKKPPLSTEQESTLKAGKEFTDNFDTFKKSLIKPSLAILFTKDPMEQRKILEQIAGDVNGFLQQNEKSIASLKNNINKYGENCKEIQDLGKNLKTILDKQIAEIDGALAGKGPIKEGAVPQKTFEDLRSKLVALNN